MDTALASQTGFLGPVDRAALRGWRLLHLDRAGALIDKGQAIANDTAAFPSLHAAYPVLIAAFFWPQVRSGVGRLLLAAYPLAMGLTLVIGGEHYVIDIVAGWAIVAAVTAMATRRGRHLPPSEQLPQQIPAAEEREHQPAPQ